MKCAHDNAKRAAARRTRQALAAVATSISILLPCKHVNYDIVEFFGFFFFILIFGYLLPCGRLYRRYHVDATPVRGAAIQKGRRPTREQIRREIKQSVFTILIFGVMATVLFEMYWAGKTSVYCPITLYPLWYAPVSFVVCIFRYDTYFYWTHRFMHWRPVFKYFHLSRPSLGHADPVGDFRLRSAGGRPAVRRHHAPGDDLPMCLGVLLLFLGYDTAVNVAGHTGFELMPAVSRKRWPYKIFNTVTHHNAHHTKTRVNYGAVFTFWDRVMGTHYDEQESHTFLPLKPASASRRAR